MGVGDLDFPAHYWGEMFSSWGSDRVNRFDGSWTITGFMLRRALAPFMSVEIM